MKFSAIFILLYLCFNCYSYKVSDPHQLFHIALDQDGKISLDWILEYSKNTVWFEVHVPAKFGWFAFGFSDRGEQFPADYCVLWFDWTGRAHFQDSWADPLGMIHLDEHDDCKGYKMQDVKGTLKFTFHRKFDTCDHEDYIIEEGTTHIVWAKGNEKLHHLEGLNVSSTNKNSGMVRVQLLRNILYSSEEPKNAKVLDIVTEKVQVPSDETTYWCHVHRLPDEYKEKHHILQYGPHIEEKNEGLVHHMEVFHCIAPADEDIPLYAGSCFDKNRPEKTQVCKRVLAAWAMGAKPFTYPDEAALPIGGPDFNPYIMLEVHYNNPQRHKGLIDSSGVRFYTTTKLRPMDAGVIELGLEYTDKMAIPPNQFAFPLTGYCVSECTAVSLPSSGITIFGSQLHTHLTGVRVYTRHIRNGIEMNELNRDDHYSTHFQEIRRLKKFVTVLPGDALITTCHYTTQDRENITLGGFAISDEMCVNYIHYFPATSLEVCKSAISDEALKAYFQYLKEWEGQDTSKDKPISTNYAAIEWNRIRVQMLLELYNEAPLGMQCNMSSGDRFPGYWENTPRTPILHPLPPPVRSCYN